MNQRNMKIDDNELALPPVSSMPKINWESPNFEGLNSLAIDQNDTVIYRLFHLTEIGEGKPGSYRLAMANVLSCLKNTDCAGVYILSGRPDGIELYVGVVSSIPDTDIHEAGKTFRASFEGNFLGAKLEKITNDNIKIPRILSGSKHLGLVTGVPSFNEEGKLDDEDFQGVERLANSLTGETWQLVLIAEPGTDIQIRDALEQIYDLSTELSAYMKHSVQHSENTGWQHTHSEGQNDSFTAGSSKTESRSKSAGASKSLAESSSDGKSEESWSKTKGVSTTKGTNEGTSTSYTTGTTESNTSGSNSSQAESKSGGQSVALTRERTDKRIEEMQKHLSETLIQRFQQGRSKGMFQTAIYVCAENKAAYERLSRGVLSIFQGNKTSVTPLIVHKIQTKPGANHTDLLQLRRIKDETIPRGKDRYNRALAHSTPFDERENIQLGATWLTAREVSLIAGLPSLELPGLKIRKCVDFALNTGKTKEDSRVLKLGKIIQHGRPLPYKHVDLSLAELTKHVFVTGVTGAGKTTTCMKLLLESELPFLVIEPAKTEYRALHNQGVEIDYYTLGCEDLTPFRLNPFELVSKHQNLASHIATLNATLAAVFPMEAAMPYIVEEAIINAYKTKGWDVHTGEHFFTEDPWALGSAVWPTFADMIAELDAVITSKGMGKEFEDKYRGSLVARLTSLTLGTKGRMLNTRYSLDFNQLIDRRVVIELEELKDEQDKALFMGLIIGRLAECMKQRHRETPKFQHLTLVEEAHRLLSRTEVGGSGPKKMGVEMFANLLAEVRKYGEGLIIADQIPNKLVPDVIKNTNTKIVHRLFAADDRNSIGDAMGLSDEQKEFLPQLQPGETIIYCGGWHAPVWVKIDQATKTDNAEIAESEIRRRGCQQLWLQRNKLLPCLAACDEMDSPEILADFLYQGGMMLNMILKINQGRGNAREVTRREKIRERLMKQFDEWRQRLGSAAAKLSHLLTNLLLDCASFPGFDESSLEMLENSCPTAVEKLCISLAEFDQFIDGDRANAFQVFKTLQKFDSI